MLYTLGKVFVWFVAAFVLGAVVGWIIHHVLRCSMPGHGAKAAKSAKAAKAAEEGAAREATNRLELKELRSRVAALEPVAQERDRLRRDLVELRASREAERNAPIQPPARVELLPDDYAALRAERDSLRGLVSRHEATIGVQAAAMNRLQSHIDSESGSAPPAPDLNAGANILGRRLRLDDLTVVVGITREIAALCYEQEIETWWALANTDVRVLRAMLEHAGVSLQEVDPSSWPQQARLLAHGSWQHFVNLARRLPGKR